MSRYVVCGATGFIGRNVAERWGALFPGQVLGVYLFEDEPPSLPGVDWIKANLCYPDQVAGLFEAGDVIFQAAAATSGVKNTFERPYTHVTDTVVISSLILRAAHERGAAQLIYPGCAAHYSGCQGRPMTEADDIVAPLAEEPFYPGAGWTRVYIEKMCEFYAGLGRTKHLVMRTTNVYGPHDKYGPDDSHMYAANIAKVIKAPEEGTVTVWGPGTEGRDLIYIDDLLDFVTRALEQKNPFEIVNVGSGQLWTVNAVVETIIKASGKKLLVEHDLAKPHIPSNIWVDTAKAQKLFGWKPKTSLAEGTAKTIKWYKANLENL